MKDWTVHLGDKLEVTQTGGNEAIDSADGYEEKLDEIEKLINDIEAYDYSIATAEIMGKIRSLLESERRKSDEKVNQKDIRWKSYVDKLRKKYNDKKEQKEN